MNSAKSGTSAFVKKQAPHFALLNAGYIPQAAYDP
jgi:hypothetical protein